MGRAVAMIFSASSGVVRRGSASSAVAAFRRSRLRDALLVRDRDEQDLASLLRLPDHADLDARRGLRELAEVAVDLRRPRQLARGPGDVAEVLRRRRHGRRGGHVGDPGISEALLGRELRDRLDRARLRHVRARRVRRRARRRGSTPGRGRGTRTGRGEGPSGVPPECGRRMPPRAAGFARRVI